MAGGSHVSSRSCVAAFYPLSTRGHRRRYAKAGAGAAVRGRDHCDGWGRRGQDDTEDGRRSSRSPLLPRSTQSRTEQGCGRASPLPRATGSGLCCDLRRSTARRASSSSSHRFSCAFATAAAPYVSATTGQQVQQIPALLDQLALPQPDVWLGRGSGGRDLHTNSDIPGWLMRVAAAFARERAHSRDWRRTVRGSRLCWCTGIR